MELLWYLLVRYVIWLDFQFVPELTVPSVSISKQRWPFAVLWSFFFNTSYIIIKVTCVMNMSSLSVCPQSLCLCSGSKQDRRKQYLLIDKNKGDSYTFKLEKALVYYLLLPARTHPLEFLDLPTTTTSFSPWRPV